MGTRVVPRYLYDVWKFTSIMFFLTMLLAVAKQKIKPQGLISPVAAGEVTVITRTETKIEKIKVSEIVDKIHALESSRGKAKEGLAVYCRDQGMSNEYGYGGMALMLCFRNHKEATAIIHMWFNLKLETKTLSQVVCMYNTGKPYDDCPYYQKFLEVK